MSPDQMFVDYARRYFGGFHAPEGGSSVSSTMLFCPGFAVDQAKVVETLGADVLLTDQGPRIAGHRASGIWCRPGGSLEELTVECSWRPPRLRRALAAVRGPFGARAERFMALLRHGLLQPVTGQLLAREGMLTLHASAVERGGRALVFTGLNGCGKSGLALYLVARCGFRFMADNFALVQPAGPSVTACPEPIRVGEVERRVAEGHFTGGTKAFGKWQMTPRAGLVCHEAALSGVVHVTLGCSFRVAAVEGRTFALRLESLHRFLAETAEYSWVQLYFLWQHGIDLASAATAARAAVCDRVPCFEMSLPLADSFDARYGEAARWVEAHLSKRKGGGE